MIQALQAINENVQAIDIKDCCVFRRGFGKTPFTAWTNNCQLNKLNQLHFDTPSSSSTKKAILEILANAPNLTTLDGPVELSWFANSSVANLLEGKIVERIQWDLCSTGPQRELIAKFVTPKPQLLEIQTTFEDFSLESDEDHITARLLSSLLESSKDTLHSLSVNFANLARFQKEKLLPEMSSLKVLIIHGYTSRGKCDDCVLIHLDALDYETLFPNLNRVEILLEQDDFLYPHEQESSLATNALHGPVEPKGAVGSTVAELVITYEPNDWIIAEGFLTCDDGSPVDWQPFEKIEQVFPNVRHICLSGLRTDRMIGRLRSLWTVWPAIESITLANVEGRSYEMKEGIDYAFLGVDKETVKALRKLEATEFNPSGPSILHKKSTWSC